MAASKFTSILLLLMTIVSTYGQTKYRVCAKLKDMNTCSQLGRRDDLECTRNINLHGVDCIHNVQYGSSDFGQITAEEGMVAASFVKDVEVIGEIRTEAFSDDSLYSTVVLVKQNYTGTLTGLRGKQFCHPGFSHDETIPELLLKEFERIVLNTNNAFSCSGTVSSDTIVERELKSVFEFFGPSCRPGPWIELKNFNADLYNRYGRLCELCDSKGKEKCSMNHNEPFMYSLECLLKVDGGDVALTTLNTIKEYFDKKENVMKKSLYKYLCKDGSVQLSDTLTPCVWSKQPWNLLIANAAHSANIATSIKEKWLQSDVLSSEAVTETEAEPLKAIFMLEKNSKIKLVERMPLKKYIELYRPIPNAQESKLCGQQIRWCTISEEEQQKCLWLAQASLNRAIQPVIECVKSVNKINCLEDIRKDKVDVVTSDAHYGYLARKKGLSPIAYPDTDPINVIRTMLVIKDKDAANIRKFGDLKDKKSCFPEYGGIEWLAFINSGRRHNIFSSSCDYGELISTFVGESCIPGSHDPEHEVTSVDKKKLCELCIPVLTTTAVTCNADKTNQFYGNLGALKCLKQSGDFAVITKEDFGKIEPNLNVNEFRVLCQNGSLSSNTGFNIDDDCALSVTVDSEVVTKRKQPNNNADVGMILLNWERRFGTDPHKAFEVFNVFNNTLDLLFKDSTPGLVATDSSKIPVKNYIQAFAHTDECLREKSPGSTSTTEPDGANVLHTPIVTIITTLLLLFISKMVF